MDVASLPKAELHLHLEGAIRLHTAVELARENEIDFPFQDARELDRVLDFRDFLHFLELFAVVNSTIAKPADYQRITRELMDDLAAQQVVYAEIRYAPMHPMRRGMLFDDITRAVLDGLAEGKRRHGIETALICGFTRQWDCGECLGLALRWAGRGLDAIDIGGDEAGFPAEGFANIYHQAREAGLQATAHAGEASGPDSVWSALRTLGVKRIGHGIRSIEDAALVAHLRAEGVTLEVCPTSNVKTGVVASLAQHPVRSLFEAGVPVTLNSDDPAMFKTSVGREYEVVAAEFGFSEPELRQVTRNAIEAGFCRPDVKRRLLASLPSA